MDKDRLERLVADVEYTIRSFKQDGASHHPQLNQAMGLLEEHMLYLGAELVCDGCFVNEGYEHRCHSVGGGGRLTIKGELMFGECSCPECKWQRDFK